MRRWIWRVLLIAAAVLALTGTAAAVEGDEVTLDNGLVIKEIADSKWKVMGFADDYTGIRNPLVIPSSYGKVGANNITEIADEAFKGSVNGKDIVTVIVPVSITKIGESAFEACPKLETVVFLEHPKNDTNKLTIKEKAFLGCRNLSNLMFSRGLGTVEPQAFGANLKLTELVIPDGVEDIQERAFAQCANLKTIYIPASLKPAAGKTEKPIAATTFSGTGLEIIHYGGEVGKEAEIKEIMDLPTGMTVWQNVHSAVNDRMITEPTCIEEGYVYGGVSCRAAQASQTDVCKSFAKTIDLATLGHDYQQTPESKESYKKALAAHEDKPCIDHKYDYEATCYRCGAKVEKEERTVPKDLTRHPWETYGSAKVFDEKTRVPATCKGPGSVSWTRKCAVCGFEETGKDILELADPSQHTYTLGNSTPDETIEATCISPGVEVTRKTCDCGKTISSCADCEAHLKAIEAIKDEPAESPADAGDEAPKETVLEKRAKAIQAYVDHLNKDHGEKEHPDDPVKFTVIPALEHTWKEEYKPTTPPTCTKDGVGTKTKTCTICGTVETDPDDTETISKLGHLWDKEDASYKEEILKEATCTEAGEKRITGKCKRADCDGTPEADGTVTAVEPIPKAGHQWKEIGENDYVGSGDKKPTCTEKGQRTTGKRVCTVCSEIEEPKVEPIDALGHLWGDFVPDEGQDTTPNTTCVEKKVTGTVTCTREGCVEKPTEHRTLTIEGLGAHTWGEWKAIEDSEDGKQVRECSVCGKKEERDDPNKPAEPDEPDEPEDPDEPDDPDDPGKPTEPETPKDYQVNIIQGSNGTTTANRTTAKSGDRVTITVSPASGYELDMLRVISADGKVLNLESLGGGQYRFTMSAANAEVRATFSKKSGSSSSGSNWASAPGEGTSSTDPRRTTDVMPTQNPVQSVPKAGAYEQLFRDIPTNHWAAGEINWANQMGYMNGTAGRFNPDGVITHQQMWMVLARLTGNHPANMAEARRWAVEHSFADGSSPTGAVARHQLVTALYRCAHLMGSTNRNTTSLAGYPDSRTVPAVARDAYSWALANGIVSGTANGRLDPNGTLTRAQFAVILYRYSQRV